MKEYLSQIDEEVEFINVLNNVEGMKKLLKLGVKTVPILTKGNQYIHAMNLEDVAKFIGHSIEKHVKLSPKQLVEKLDLILAAFQRYLYQVPESKFEVQVVEGRNRSFFELGYHIFNIVESFIITCYQQKLTIDMKSQSIPKTIKTKSQLKEYGYQIRKQINQWWVELSDRSCEIQVETYYGNQSVHELLERMTWHIAQHVRETLAFLIRQGINPDRPLTMDDLAGLPLPKN